jgi:hypothetical protein
MSSDDLYYEKYLKYKIKYLMLQEELELQQGGAWSSNDMKIVSNKFIENGETEYKTNFKNMITYLELFDKNPEYKQKILSEEIIKKPVEWLSFKMNLLRKSFDHQKNDKNMKNRDRLLPIINDLLNDNYNTTLFYEKFYDSMLQLNNNFIDIQLVSLEQKSLIKQYQDIKTGKNVTDAGKKALSFIGNKFSKMTQKANNTKLGNQLKSFSDRFSNSSVGQKLSSAKQSASKSIKDAVSNQVNKIDANIQDINSQAEQFFVEFWKKVIERNDYYCKNVVISILRTLHFLYYKKTEEKKPVSQEETPSSDT